MTEEIIDKFKYNTYTNHKHLLSQASSIPSLLRMHPFLNQIPSLIQTVSKFEDPMARDTVLGTIDLETIYAGVDKRMKNDDDYTRCLIKEVLHWFKHDFFRWVNEPDVPEGYGKPRLIRMEQGNSEEMKDGALRVEVYQCENGQLIRFPRYNNPVKLLKTRQGRCGEWANCFCLIMRALGFKVRYVWNLEDHVWCEVYHDNRWIHLDPCEDAYDNAELYNKGWGKAMSYCIGVSIDGVQDVSKRYVVDPEKSNARDKIDEVVLQKGIELFSAVLRKDKSDDETMVLTIEDYFENLELSGQLKSKTTPTSGVQPRQSGSAEWTKARGESG
jgi:peptide-N4-(N-acetyl-beta-glucosaminyl)asparagine amidase